MLGEKESAQRILTLWAAGDALNRGDNHRAERFFRSAPRFEKESPVAGLIGRADLEMWAVDLARRFPLTDEELARIEDGTDWSELARELVARCSPKWFLAWRDICRSTDERTLIAAVLPRVAVGNSTQLLLRNAANRQGLAWMLANFSCFVCDYVVRQKTGGTHINHQLMKQFPIFPPGFYLERQPWQPLGEPFGDWVKVRVLELTYTAYDLRDFAADCGYSGPPFEWDELRRAALRAELDAAYLHAYGLNRDDSAYVLSAANFPIVAAKQPDLRSSILAVYDAMSESTRSGRPFCSPLSPSPGKYTPQ